MKRAKLIVFSVILVAIAVGTGLGVASSSGGAKRRVAETEPNRVAPAGRETAARAGETPPTAVERALHVSGEPPAGVTSIQTRDAGAPLHSTRSREQQEWLGIEMGRATAMAQRLRLSEEQTAGFMALKRAHNEARAEVLEILRENPALASHEAVESILAERLGVQAVVALRQRSHLTAVHAVIGDERFDEYRTLVDSGDWEGASAAPSTP